jgi:thiol:disulfide interchange protein DsbA
MKKLVLFLMLTVSPLLSNAGEFVAGKHYKEIAAQATDTGDKIEVLEFFWYGCPHCYSFEPYAQAWKKTKSDNVAFARVPAVFRPDWEVQAKTYYALSVMGIIEDMHVKIFDAVHKDKRRLGTFEQMAAFLELHGVDKAAFTKEYNSFAVDSMVRKGKKKQKAYNISGVPTVIVNGKYLATGSMAGSYEKLVDIINYLTKKEAKK